MKFKVEVCLLALSIALFAAAMFFYTYQPADAALSLTAASPYRGLALAFVGVGSVSMVTASVSYQKKTKHMLQ
ncbi:MAG: hypothetical protein NWE93_03475 [Candidatus Bathyarchaeota archaeon]|nr:hypothetical protein [Candidatus Bathyarchaeota archaeon]